MKARLLQCLWAALLLPTPLWAQGTDGLFDALSSSPDWSVSASIDRYSDRDLEGLAGDRTGEILDYGFRQASKFEMRDAAGTVSVTLYEMLDSPAAHGLFSMNRDYTAPGFEALGLGAESYRDGNRLVFWQARYVASLSGPPAATAAAAGFMTTHLPGLSRKAPVSMHLPSENLISTSERYILSPSALESETSLDPVRLGLENSVEVAVADYGSREGRVRLALLMYPTAQLATLQADSWMADLAEAPPYRRVGPLLGVVTENENPALAESVLSGLSYQTETTWSAPPEDPLTLPEMVLAIFTWIGAALLFTLVVGLGFGGLRIYMKARHPGRLFPSDEEVHLVQLKINQQVTEKQLRS